MAKPARKRIWSFIKHCWEHVRDMFALRQGPAPAARGVAKEWRRLVHKLRAEPDSEDHRKAKQFVNKGVHAYNEGDYQKAIYYFERATRSEEKYALAWLYLGDAKHKRGQATEAIEAWQRAAQVGPGTEAAERALSHLNSAIRQVREGFLQ